MDFISWKIHFPIDPKIGECFFKYCNIQMSEVIEFEKKVKIQLYASYFTGHIIPILKIAEILQEQNPSFDIAFYCGIRFISKFQKSFPKVKMIEIIDTFTELDYNRTIEGSHEAVQKEANIYLSQHFANKIDKPDLLISDFFVMEAFRWANRNGIKCILNLPCSYNIMHLVLNSLMINNSHCIEGFTIFKILPRVNFFKYFDQLSDQIRYKNRVIINSFIGLDEATMIPSNHTLIGLLSNRSGIPQEINEQLANWMQSWKDKGKKKFLYISFGSILNLSNQLALSIARAIQKLEYPTIWSLRSENRHEITSKYIFHREWLPQQAILNQPEVRAYLTHCGWGSITEAVATKTLLVCAPIFADQQNNSDVVVNKHIGVKVYESPEDVIVSVLKITIDEDKLYSSVRKVMEDDSYVLAMEKVHKLSKTYDTPKLLSKVVNETLEFGIEHLISPAYERTSIKSTKGTTIKQIIAEKWWPSLETKQYQNDVR